MCRSGLRVRGFVPTKEGRLIVAFGLVVLAIVVFVAAVAVAAPSSRHGSAVGRLDRDARRADRGSAPSLRSQSRAVERAAEQQAAQERALRPRAGHALARPGETLSVEELGVARRQFLNRGIGAMVGVAASGFVGSVLAFVWPVARAGFGGRVDAGAIDVIRAKISESRAPYYVPAARSYVVMYPPEALLRARAVYPDSVVRGMSEGVVALFQRCPHLGCRVPWCGSSQWFECPCHGSKYNRVGEKRDGPAPRGMDRFAIAIEGGALTIDTSQLAQGPPVGTDTTRQKPEGPACV
jgi:cytochrome b6-f complex iron-sulfur subunit